jgi:hypothetical protein
VREREESYRLYSCRGCSVSVSICGRCDRGNIFCAGGCAAVSRRESRRRAGARYQRTRRGARRHAARQEAWRERQIDKVTHRGCAPTGPVFTMSVRVNTAAIELNDAQSALDRPLATPRKAERSPQRESDCATIWNLANGENDSNARVLLGRLELGLMLIFD